MDVLSLILLILCIALGAFCARLYASRARLQSDNQALGVRQEGLRQQLSDQQQQFEREREQFRREREQAEREQQLKDERFRDQLKLVQSEMRQQFDTEMKQRTTQLKADNQEAMQQVTQPLREELERLHRLVDTQRQEQTRHVSALEAGIKAVVEHDRERDKTTQSLADALKNKGKVQGDWGEQVLENILRDSGLREGEEYERQHNVKDAAGANDRPDIIVRGAGGAVIIIDSKVSLTAYTDYCGAANDDERRTADRANYDSIWRHVTELSAKKYPTLVDKSMPVTLMFVPNEGSYILAMNRDPQLGIKAYNKGVLIVNPTNLMVVLRLMFLSWQSTRQEKNSRAILDAASKIYEKYATVCDTLVTLGNQLTTVRTTYDRAIGQMREGRGNLSKQLQDLLRLGATATKQIPESLEGLE